MTMPDIVCFSHVTSYEVAQCDYACLAPGTSLLHSTMDNGGWICLISDEFCYDEVDESRVMEMTLMVILISLDLYSIKKKTRSMLEMYLTETATISEFETQVPRAKRKSL